MWKDVWYSGTEGWSEKDRAAAKDGSTGRMVFEGQEHRCQAALLEILPLLLKVVQP